MAELLRVQNTVVVEVNAIIKHALELGLTVMQQNTPVDTGYLRSRDQIGEESTGVVIIYTLFNDADYAQYVCLGTRFMAAQDFLAEATIVTREAITGGLNGLVS